MEHTTHYRHERKYALSQADAQALRLRLRHLMQRDNHAGPDGRYLIRSIYLDNYRDSVLREKLDGLPQREKFRIRWYNDDLHFITLEKKSKWNDLCCKSSTVLTQEGWQHILCADRDWMQQQTAPLIRELAVKMATQQLRSRVVVSYLREAYVYAAGNVRVTFDSDLRTSLFHPNFSAGVIPDIPTADTPGEQILEVKYDDFLPDVIACLLQTGTLRQQAFSKYGASRRFG